MGRHASVSPTRRPRRTRSAGILGWGVFVAACALVAGLLFHWPLDALLTAAGLPLIGFAVVYALGAPPQS